MKNRTRDEYIINDMVQTAKACRQCGGPTMLAPSVIADLKVPRCIAQCWEGKPNWKTIGGDNE
jgi:hypothetical protein